MKYVKSTVCNYKSAWKRAPDALKDQFIAYGNTSRGCWRNFATALKKADSTPEGANPTQAADGSSSSKATVETSNTNPELVIAASSNGSSSSKATMETHNTNPEFVVTPSLKSISPLSEEGMNQPPVSLILEPPVAKLAISELSAVELEIPQPPMGQVEPFHIPSPLQPEFQITPSVQAANAILNTAFVKVEPDESLFDEDPKTLCEFCDMQLPDVPSAKLVKIRASLENKTWPDPTAINPLHRSASNFQVYIPYCTQHIFETDQLPLALAGKWPLQPDFGRVFDRVCRNYLLLSAVAGSKVNDFFIAAKEYYSDAQNRRGGIFSQFGSGRFIESGAG